MSEAKATPSVAMTTVGDKQHEMEGVRAVRVSSAKKDGDSDLKRKRNKAALAPQKKSRSVEDTLEELKASAVLVQCRKSRGTKGEMFMI